MIPANEVPFEYAVTAREFLPPAAPRGLDDAKAKQLTHAIYILEEGDSRIKEISEFMFRFGTPKQAARFMKEAGSPLSDEQVERMIRLARLERNQWPNLIDTYVMYLKMLGSSEQKDMFLDRVPDLTEEQVRELRPSSAVGGAHKGVGAAAMKGLDPSKNTSNDDLDGFVILDP